MALSVVMMRSVSAPAPTRSPAEHHDHGPEELTASAVLTALVISGKGLAMRMCWPVRDLLGNRDDPPALPAWPWRADRAHRNMLENFPDFAALFVVVSSAGLSNASSALGARVAHAVLYMSGAWRLRWIAFFAGLGGSC